MADLRAQFGFDKKAAEEGVKMFVGMDEKTEYVVIRRWRNEGYNEALTKAYQANKRKLEFLKEQNEADFRKLDMDLTCGIQAEHLIVEFGPGVMDGKKKIPNTVDGRKQLLLKYPDFRLQCIEFAMDNKNYPLEPDVEDIKKP